MWSDERCTCPWVVKNTLPQLITYRAHLDLEEAEHHEQGRHAAAAYRAFCDGFGLPRQARQAFVLDAGSRLDRPLLVHAAALLTPWSQTRVEGPTEPAGTVPAVSNAGRLLDDLISAEVMRLLRLRRGDDPSGAPVFHSDREVREALCAVALTGPARANLPDLLACTEVFGPSGNTNRIPAAALLECFSIEDPQMVPDPLQRSLAPVEPDLIARPPAPHHPGPLRPGEAADHLRCGR